MTWSAHVTVTDVEEQVLDRHGRLVSRVRAVAHREDEMDVEQLDGSVVKTPAVSSNTEGRITSVELVLEVEPFDGGNTPSPPLVGSRLYVSGHHNALADLPS